MSGLLLRAAMCMTMYLFKHHLACDLVSLSSPYHQPQQTDYSIHYQSSLINIAKRIRSGIDKWGHKHTFYKFVKKCEQVTDELIDKHIWKSRSSAENFFLPFRYSHSWRLVFERSFLFSHSGIQVTGARPGSVILDIVVKYADSVTPKQAFDTFKQIIETPATATRVQNVLQVTHPFIRFFILPLLYFCDVFFFRRRLEFASLNAEFPIYSIKRLKSYASLAHTFWTHRPLGGWSYRFAAVRPSVSPSVRPLPAFLGN